MNPRMERARGGGRTRAGRWWSWLWSTSGLTVLLATPAVAFAQGVADTAAPPAESASGASESMSPGIPGGTVDYSQTSFQPGAGQPPRSQPDLSSQSDFQPGAGQEVRARPQGSSQADFQPGAEPSEGG